VEIGFLAANFLTCHQIERSFVRYFSVRSTDNNPDGSPAIWAISQGKVVIAMDR